MRYLVSVLVVSTLALSTPAALADLGDQLFKLLPEDGELGNAFGWDVAISGTTAIAGSLTDNDNGSSSGSAYLFDTTTGQQTHKLLPDDGDFGKTFGQSVGISGTTAIVGAHSSAYLFSTTTGQQTHKLLPDVFGLFGSSVGTSGTTAIVGAFAESTNGITSGAAYLFDTTTGRQIAKLLPDDGAAGDGFGTSVAISGATAIVGAPGDEDNGTESGSTYLFDTTTGQQIAKLLPDDGTSSTFFGYSVAISGNRAIVGGPAIRSSFSGSAAYLFDIADPVNPVQIAKLLPDSSSGNTFGLSVAISGTTAIVRSSLGFTTGAAYLFDTTTGEQIAKLLPNDGAGGDAFGFSVGISDTIAVVGAYRDGDNGRLSGSAYLFDVAGVGDSLPECPGETGDCGGQGSPSGSSGLCGASGASLAMMFGLLLMRFGYRRPTCRT